MTEQELKRIANKISKCLALTKSDNPKEATAAKRQAELMMKKYNITSVDINVSQINEKHIKSGGKYKAPLYLGALAMIIGKAFGCGVIGHPGKGWLWSTISFMGVGIKPDLASYTFDVLARQIKKDRTAYQSTLKRFKPKNKQRMADLFCQGWVAQIQSQVHDFAGTEKEQQAIEAYKQKQYKGTIKSDNRKLTEAQKDRDYDAYNAAAKAAKNVSIHKPMQTKNKLLLN